MTPRGIVAFSLLALAAVGSWLLSQSLNKERAEISTTTDAGSRFYLRAARILGTGADGQLLYEIDADFAEQVANNLIELNNVHIKYSPGSDVPWRLAADFATISGDQDFLLLEGNVVATSSTGFSGEVTEIRTQHLEFDPRDYKAETSVRVQVRVGSRSLTANSMLALFKDNRLILNSNVNGKFVP